MRLTKPYSKGKILMLSEAKHLWLFAMEFAQILIRDCSVRSE